jgi:hypothetical protein
MTISSFDDVIAAYASAQTYNYWKYPANVLFLGDAGGSMNFNALWTGGSYGAFSVGTPGLNGRYIDGTTEPGVIPYTNATGGKQKYLLNFGGKLTIGVISGLRSAALIDLIWINSDIVGTTTGNQVFTPGALPNRDENGSNLGHGLRAGIVVTGVPISTNNSATYNYTNQAGVSRTNVAMFDGILSASTVGTLIPLALYPGDTGVRSIDGITLNTSLGTGVISTILYRDIAMMSLDDNVGQALGATLSWQSLCLPKLYDDTALVPLIYNTDNGSMYTDLDITLGEA